MCKFCDFGEPKLRTISLAASLSETEVFGPILAHLISEIAFLGNAFSKGYYLYFWVAHTK